MSVRNRLTAARRALRTRRPPLPPPPSGDGFPSVFTRMSTLSFTDGQDLTIAADAHYLYDLGSAPALTFGHIVVNGKLSFDKAANQKFTAKSVTNYGKFAATTDDSFWPSGKKLNIIANGPEEGKVAAYMVDQTASGGAGNGVLKRLWQSTSIPPTADETITVTFTSSTNFNVSGTVSGTNFGTGTVGTLFNNKVRFIATAGTTAWAAGHTRTLRVERKGWLNDSRSRGIRNMPGGKMIFKGFTKTPFTRLQGTSAAPMVSGNVMPLADVVSGWELGDETVITTTDYYYWGSNTSTQLAKNELFTINALDAPGKQLTLSGNLERSRCAQKQWISEDGVDAIGRELGSFSWSPTGFVPHAEGIPDVIDQRAWALNLTRNIVFEGADDAAWQDTTNGRLGIHIMNMGLESEFILEYVEVKRGGQRGRHGRYAIHNHMPSYNMPDGGGFPSDGAFLGDCDETKQRLVGCVVNRSAQHAVQNHGACGWKVYDTIGHDIDGHCFNTEDGSELRYGFVRCVASKVNKIAASNLLQTKAHEVRAAGFWLTNQGGDCYDGAAINCERNMWTSNAKRCFGLSRDVDIVPLNVRPGRIKTMHLMCTPGDFLMVNGGEITDERGATEGYMDGLKIKGALYYPKDNDAPSGNYIRPVLLEGFEFFKSEKDAYSNRVSVPEYTKITGADCAMTILTGNVNSGRVSDSLLCGRTLNGQTRKGVTTDEFLRAAFASYHNTQINQNCLFVNFPAKRPGIVSNKYQFFTPEGTEITGGAGQSFDFYQNVIEQGFKQHTGIRFLSADPGVRSREWNHRQLSTGEADDSYYNTSMTHGDKDWQGWWGPAGWWRTLNTPFHTTGLSASQPVYNGFGAGAVVDPYWVMTPDKIIGLAEVTMDTDIVDPATPLANMSTSVIDARISELNCTLLDSSYADVANYTLKRGNRSANLHYKRFLGLRKGLRYRMTLGTTAAPSRFSVWAIYNADDTTDTIVMSFPWAPATARVYVYSGHQIPGLDKSFPLGTYADAKIYTAVGSLAALEASTGRTYWHDTTNHVVWVKYQGGDIQRPVKEVPNDFDMWNQDMDNRPNTLYIVP